MAHILSVSYDETLLRSREMLLEHQGYSVLSSLGFTESLEQCASHNFDLFILGHSIPLSDKQMLVDTFRKHCSAPIIALRRNAFEGPIRGVDHHIEPDPEVLLSLAARILQQNDAAREVAKTG